MKTKYFLLSAFFLVVSSACGKKETIKSAPQSKASDTIVKSDTLPTDAQGIRKESINLFILTPKDSSDIAFVSLSDIYPGDDQDTLALPNIEKMGKHDAQYFTFEKNYRKRFLSKINVLETDSVFVYDYAKNKRVSFAVKNLKTAAMLNGYSIGEDWPYQNYDFMIGFEINKKYLKGFSEYYQDALVYVGKENPFSKQPLTPIKWKKITAKEFPSKAIKNEDQKILKGTTPADIYTFKTNDYHYFLQNYNDNRKIIYARRLLVINAKTNEIIIDNLYSPSEGTSPTPLNYKEGDDVINQWTGKLFKNKPPVVFGFLYKSFGCPEISIIDKSNEEIYLQCDNRH
ncbi:oxidoreductase [Flavobacterium ginsengiterrae]|uniref:Oxidoreductase n=1 Tax=Flavobacterium ginsengiterrae TaxID=871695 RepID=A0ABP7GCR1_9FLAO